MWSPIVGNLRVGSWKPENVELAERLPDLGDLRRTLEDPRLRRGSFRFTWPHVLLQLSDLKIFVCDLASFFV